ncbi:STT3 domain-containing protein [Calditerrivibrio nitroreducens]|uniref:STT3 domain-containing protein n=1 Tax=Calditerrivibrio nitroreducens TaxID=477976 RepID=UPI003C72DFBD
MLKNRKFIRVAIFLLILLIVGISSGFRYYQLYDWKVNHPSYFVGNTVSLTTLDGYYWLRLAKTYDNLTDKNTPDTYRGYPDYPYTYKLEMNNLLVYLINKTSKLIGNYYYAGVYLVIILSSLFIIPLFLYLSSCGFTSPAIVATLLTTFSYSYLYRTFVGRVDTDCLNLFFPFMMSYLIYLIPRLEGYRRYIASIALGITAYLFMWWYPYPGFLIVYLGVFVLYLIIKKVKFWAILTSSVLFILFANPKYFITGIDNIIYFIFGSKYFAGEAINVNKIAWPNIAEFISETQKQGWQTILLYAAGNKYLGLAGLIGLALFILRLRFDILPLLPILLLGLISFKSGNRFTMYLSPFIFAGLGFLIYFSSEYFVYNGLKVFKKYVKMFTETISTIISIIFVAIAIYFFSGIHYKPTPSVPLNIQQTMIDMRNRFGAAPVVWTWWDFGYAYQDLTNFSTVHDGGIHGKERTYFVGLSLSLPDQMKMRNIISYFDNKGFRMLEKGDLDPKKIVLEATNFTLPVKNRDILVVVSYDMVHKYDGIDFFAKWDFDKKKSDYDDYEKLSCNYDSSTLRCNDVDVDLTQGGWGDEQLSKVYIIDESGILKYYDFNVDGRIIQIVLKNNQVFISYILDDSVFQSNFNQLYFFGKYDAKIFEKVYDNFPIMRVFRVK